MALADCLISYISAAHIAYSQIAYLQHHHIAYNLARSLTSIMRPTNLQSHRCKYCILLNSDPADMSLHMRSEMASRILYIVEQRSSRHVAACAVGNSFPSYENDITPTLGCLLPFSMRVFSVDDTPPQSTKFCHFWPTPNVIWRLRECWVKRGR